MVCVGFYGGLVASKGTTCNASLFVEVGWGGFWNQLGLFFFFFLG